MHRIYQLLVISSLLLCFSCKAIPQQSITPDQQTEIPLTHQIIFLNLEIKEDSVTNKKDVSLIKTIVSKGKLKPQINAYSATEPGDLKCSFLAADGTVLHIISIPDPLERTVEYVSEAGEFKKSTLLANRASFSLRAPFMLGTERLLVQQVQTDRQLKDLNMLNLSI